MSQFDLFMTTPELLTILKKDVQAWNQWRAENPELNIDFCDANLIGVDLIGVNLSRVNLSRTSLMGVNLIEANLTHANLTQANLTHANLIRAELTHADLRSADLSRAYLSKANLHDADLRNADLSRAYLTGACIQDWKINPQTNLKDLVAKYLYLNSQWNSDRQQDDFLERRPIEPNRQFNPDELLQLLQSYSQELPDS